VVSVFLNPSARQLITAHVGDSRAVMVTLEESFDLTSDHKPSNASEKERVELLGGLMYPIQLFGMDFELCQQGLALLALVPIWLYRGRQGYHSKPFQYACYAFYPVHMLLLFLVLNFVNR